MNLLRLAELFVIKYAVSAENLENSVRADIHQLWKFPNENFNILRVCAESNPKNPKTDDDVKAIKGFKFCQQLLTMIDYMKVHMKSMPLGQMREILLTIVNLIQENIHLKFKEETSIQFPHVSELIFQMIGVKTKHDRKVRDEQFGKAKTGLSRILSLSLTMLEKLEKLEMMDPSKFNFTDLDQKLPERFIPQRAPLSVYDIVDFIRQHGLEYGISNKEDWETVFTNDPELRERMTTVINAINRGLSPKDSFFVKTEIAKILKEFKERKFTNEQEFEDA